MEAAPKGEATRLHRSGRKTVANTARRDRSRPASRLGWGDSDTVTTTDWIGRAVSNCDERATVFETTYDLGGPLRGHVHTFPGGG